MVIKTVENNPTSSAMNNNFDSEMEGVEKLRNLLPGQQQQAAAAVAAADAAASGPQDADQLEVILRAIRYIFFSSKL